VFTGKVVQNFVDETEWRKTMTAGAVGEIESDAKKETIPRRERSFLSSQETKKKQRRTQEGDDKEEDEVRL